MNKRLFLDMDGTLAKFHDEDKYLERMFEKGFFKNLAPFENLVDSIIDFSQNNRDVEIFIVSACVDGEPPYCKAEKNLWCDRYLPFINENHRIFTPMGHRKSDFIPGGITKNDYLLDDYNKNLEQWQQDGGSSIKCKNNINHKGLIGKLWEGTFIDNSSNPMEILFGLLSFMDLPFLGVFINNSNGIVR